MDPFLALIDTRIRQMPTPVLVSFAVVLIGLVCVLDARTGPETATEFLYLLPVGFVAYFASVWMTRGVCTIAAGAWLAADLWRLPETDAAWFPFGTRARGC